MTYEEFVASTDQSEPSPTCSAPLKALWYDAIDDWERAHDIAQDIESPEGSWIHAYLHRKEGDLSNARYWYRLAGKKEWIGSLEDEWEHMVKLLL